MHTLEEVRTQTHTLLKETEEQVAQLRQQRTILECLTRELLKLDARLKQHGIDSDKLPQLLASRGFLPSPFPLLQAERQRDHGQRVETKPDQERVSLAPPLAALL
jgi:hypothetical protein